MKVAVLIPCYNESLTIEKVVADFRRELPDADVFVYDNNSSDGSAELAAHAGAVVRHVAQQGKGFVVRRMFQEVEADVYVLVDGDDTYPDGARAALPDAHLRVLRHDGVVAVVRHRARPRRGEEAVRPVVRAGTGECVSASP